MPSRRREQELLDRMWERVRPLLPAHPPHPKGGRPFADDRACFAGVVFALRNAVRWNHLPACFPSGATCWRRHRDWTRAGVWARVWEAVLAELAAAGLLDTRELCLDATFAEDRQGGVCNGRTGCGVGMKVAIVVDRTGMPVGVATDAASVPETLVGPAAVACILRPVWRRLRWGLPLIADRAYDSDELRNYFADEGFTLIAPHRRNRKRRRTADGRRLRRYKRRWIVERTFAWLHSFRRVVTRFEKRVEHYDGFVHLACAFIALNRLVK